MEGILLVDKPSGWTSFDVVNYVRKIVAQIEGKKPKNVKVGHTGTLDPFATGLLILVIGKNYTRRAGEFSKLDKSYEVTAQLGETSTTGDPEGDITSFAEAPIPEKAAIETVARQFIGVIEQIPPPYSAIKVNGHRAYKLARAGKEVSIEPRKVTVHGIELKSYDYPKLVFAAHVSSGTYIRTLVTDIAKALSTGAYTSQLRRTKVGTYDVEDAITIESLNVADIERYLNQPDTLP